MDSTLGEGSVFRIYLPIGNVQFTQEELEYEKVVKSYSDHRNMLMDEIALLNDAMEKDEPEIIEDKTGMPRVLLVEGGL